MTNFSPIFGFWEGVQGDPAIANAWGTPNSLNYTLVENAIAGFASVNIGGQTSFTINKVAGAADNWKAAVIAFTGALLSPCTVTVPNVPRAIGRFVNQTTGGQNVIVTTGVGTTISLPPTGATFEYQIDASGNVTTPQLAIVGTPTNDNAIAGQVGEYQSNFNAAPVGLPVATTFQMTALPLTGGDWDVQGVIQLLTYVGGATVSNNVQAWINSVNNTAPATPSKAVNIGNFGTGHSIVTLTTRIVLPSNGGTAFLTGFVSGAGLTGATGRGFISARRAR